VAADARFAHLDDLAFHAGSHHRLVLQSLSEVKSVEITPVMMERIERELTELRNALQEERTERERQVERLWQELAALRAELTAFKAAVEERFKAIEERFRAIEERLRAIEGWLRTLVLLILTTWLSTLAAIIALFFKV
jgi:flagellar motility protein MotE (MotC chaperone)